MPDEYYQDPSRHVWTVVQIFEGYSLAIFIQHHQTFDFLQTACEGSVLFVSNSPANSAVLSILSASSWLSDPEVSVSSDFFNDLVVAWCSAFAACFTAAFEVAGVVPSLPTDAEDTAMVDLNVLCRRSEVANGR